MKIDRLLGITVYLINHKRVSAKVLAEHFEVSIRTIIRDIETLCLAGIPVCSNYGAEGGYELLDSFRLERQVMGNVDYGYIVAALQGLSTAYDSKILNETLEKMKNLNEGKNQQDMILDFGVLQENTDTNEKLIVLKEAIAKKRQVTFEYINSNNMRSRVIVEPVAALYKWYSWYLLCYSAKHQDYCLYKLVRMEEVEISEKENSKEHDIDKIQKSWNAEGDARRKIKVRLLGKAAIRSKCQEYLKGEVLEVRENGDFLYEFTVIENESFWVGMLLSMGDLVKVIEPKEVIDKIKDACQKVLNQYE